MNKRFAFLALALASSFLFFGCDNILETLYPEFAEGGGNNETGHVNVHISYDSSMMAKMGFTTNTTPIYVALVPFMQTYYGYDINHQAKKVEPIYLRDFQWNSDNGRQEATVSFKVDFNAVYKVIAWYDEDNNHWTDEATPEPGKIVFTESGDWFLDLRYYMQSMPSIHLGTTLNTGDRISWVQFMSDPTSGGQGGENQPPNNPTIEAPIYTVPANGSIPFNARNDYDPDGWIVEWKWTVSSPQTGSQDIYGNTLTHTFTNSNPSNPVEYTVRLTITDNRGASSWSEVRITVFQEGQEQSNMTPVALINNFNGVYNLVGGDYLYLGSNSYDNDGYISGYEWEVSIDDGAYTAASYGSVLSYSVPSGNYSLVVRLTVTDNAGASSNMGMNFSVYTEAQNNPPIAQFTPSVYGNVAAGTALSFTSTSYDPDGSVASYAWYVNDVYSGSGSALDLTDLPYGNYSVKLEATDNDGDSAMSSVYSFYAFSGSAPGASDNPIQINDLNPHTYYVSNHGQMHFSFNVSGSNFKIRLFNLPGDIDIYYYGSDSTFGSWISSSTYGGNTAELINATGAPNPFYVRVYDYSGGGGNFTIQVEPY